MGDNSIKVIRFDNNKVKVHVRSVQLDQDSVQHPQMQFDNGHIVVPHKQDL